MSVRISLYWCAFVILLALSACLPASPDPLAAQLAQGEPIYARDCATELCHGLNGEGIPAGDGFRIWPSVGPQFAARNPNAQVIFDVVRSGSEANLRALSDEQVYAAIAYELHLNGVQLSEPLTGLNAAAIRSGPESPSAAWGSLYPPPGNARLLEPLAAPAQPPQAANDQLALRVDQLARASVIGRTRAPEGGYLLVLVFAMQNLGPSEIAIEPERLQLIDTQGRAHDSAPANLAYPMERFHRMTIRPGYGLAGYEIFLLPPGAEHEALRYDDPRGPGSLEINLR